MSIHGRRPSVPAIIATDCAGVIETGVESGSNSCAASRSSVLRHHFRESDHRVPLSRDQLWHVSVDYRELTRSWLNVQSSTSMAQLRCELLHYLTQDSLLAMGTAHC